MIRKARIADLIPIKKITEACTTAIIDKGIYQWNSEYPSLTAFKKDIEEQNLYVYENKGAVIGCIMFSQEKDPLYDSIQWLTDGHKNLYIHRLAVHPNVQKQGIARQMMDFAEAYAIREKMISIRLDTFSKNSRNIRFYKARGYAKLGDVYFIKQSQDPFHCFEKVVKRI